MEQDYNILEVALDSCRSDLINERARVRALLELLDRCVSILDNCSGIGARDALLELIQEELAKE